MRFLELCYILAQHSAQQHYNRFATLSRMPSLIGSNFNRQRPRLLSGQFIVVQRASCLLQMIGSEGLFCDATKFVVSHRGFALLCRLNVYFVNLGSQYILSERYDFQRVIQCVTQCMGQLYFYYMLYVTLLLIIIQTRLINSEFSVNIGQLCFIAINSQF